jgi:transcriptional regulator with XRE-family HTH domain
MDMANDISEFLTSRRARLTPEQVGLPSLGTRRVKGLRREEVASLAGVSADYYKRLERGNLAGVSDMVLEALARALQLDDAERAHLFDLARAATPGAPRRSRPAPKRVRPVVQRILDALDTPAMVRNGRFDILGANRLGRALYAPIFESQEQPANTARFLFLDPAGADYLTDWAKAADDTVAFLRSEAGRNPYDRELANLIGELSTRSDEFRVRWGAHNVRFHRSGVKHMHHPLVGDLELNFEAMELTADPGLLVNIYSAEPGTKSEESLRILGSWSAAGDHAGDTTASETKAR